jgi:hypothetical protein
VTSETDPIDPPIPVPDVSGADVPAGADGLPPRSALSPRERMVVEASAIGDLALRTWVASVLATTVAPVVLATSVRQRSGTERSKLNFYAELAAEHDPGKSFPAPIELPQVWSRPANRLAEWIARGMVDNIAFASSFTAINPAMRKQWSSLTSNNIVCAQHWRHDDGPRPTLCVIHGFMGSSYLAQRAVLFAAVVLPVRLRRADVHVAVSRPTGRKVLAVQRFRLFRRRAQRFRGGDGPSRA